MTQLVPTKTEPRCETCRLSPDLRSGIDGWIGRLGQDSELGKVTWQLIRQRVWPILTGTAAPSETSIKRHRKLHTRALNPEGNEERTAEDIGAAGPDTEALLEEITVLLEGGQIVSPQGVLSLQLRGWLIGLRAKLERGEEIRLTPDQAQRAATQLIQSERQAGEADLLALMARGLSSVYQHAFAAPRTTGELEPGAIVIVDVDEENDDS